MATCIYQHNTSGDQFAIRCRDNADQDIIGASGPLYYADALSFLDDNWDDEPELTEEFRATGLADYHDVTEDVRRNG